MGFFDKVKAMKNTLTGGGAEVFLTSENVSFDEPFQITVKAHVKDAPIKINRVYIELKSFEEIEVPDFDVVYESDGEEHRRVEIVEKREETLNLELTIADAQELDANESYEWTVDVELPSHARPFYRGKYCQHYYTAMAGLDAFGNDPDSGWVELPEQ